MITWWDSQTLGTQLYTLRRGKLVGADTEGNRYFKNADGSRRWVIYNGDMEASRISPEWHGWLHHTFASPPSEKPFETKVWQAPPQRNLTGTPAAYVPAGSLRAPQPKPRQDYSAWDPNQTNRDSDS